jgi:hypothetical protein
MITGRQAIAIATKGRPIICIKNAGIFSLAAYG